MGPVQLQRRHMVEHQPGPAVTHLGRQTLRRLARIEHDVGRSRLPDPKQRGQSLDARLHHHRHSILQPHPLQPQPARQTIGCSIELAKLDATIAAHYRQPPRVLRGNPLHALVDQRRVTIGCALRLQASSQVRSLGPTMGRSRRRAWGFSPPRPATFPDARPDAEYLPGRAAPRAIPRPNGSGTNATQNPLPSS